jgi:tetratricopeptide (TPR) repeat protein
MIRTFAALVVFGALAWFAGIPLVREFQGSFAAKEFKERGVLGTYHHHFLRFFGQVDELAVLDRENDKLVQKAANLEKKVILSETRNVERELAALNEMVEERLRDDAGSELAVAQKNIEYQIPKNLSYNQLQVLALSLFKKKEFGPSALIFQHLLTLKEETRYRVPENYLLSGISWYHLKHFHLAAQSFKEARENSHPADDSHRNAMVWLALVQKGLGKRVLAQDSLLKFLELYPHSEEAAMINGGRKPAREIHEPRVHDPHGPQSEVSKSESEHKTEHKPEHKDEGTEAAHGTPVVNQEGEHHHE